MIEDNYNILKLIKEKHGQLSVENIPDMLIDGFKRELMSKNDENLVNFIFSPDPTQEKLDKF